MPLTVAAGGPATTVSGGGGSGLPWQFKVDDYGAVGDNTTNDTAAIQATVNAAVTYAQAHNYYAEVIFQPRTYLLSSPTTKGGATFGNAQITLPYVPTTGQKVVLALIGTKGASSYPHWQQTTVQRSGAVLRSTLTGLTLDGTWQAPSVIGGPTVSQGTGIFSNICPVIDGLTVVAPYNPDLVGFDLGYCAQAEVISAGAFGNAAPAGSPPLTSGATNDLGVGLRMPFNLNNDKSYIVDYACEGYPYGLATGEHLAALRVSVVAAKVGLYVAGIGGGYYHGINIVNFSAELCQTVIQAGGTPGGGQPIVINQVGVETNSGLLVDDPNNVLRGYIGWANYQTHTPTVNGAINVKIEDLNTERGLKTAPSLPATTVALLNPFWRDCAVTVTGGTVTAIAVDGTTLGVTSGTVIVPSGKTITLTYSSAPTWKWIAL